MNQVLTVTGDAEVILINFLDINLPRNDKGGNTIWKSSNVAITLYSTGKVLFQGKEADQWFTKVSDILGNATELRQTSIIEDEHSLNTTYNGTPRVGIDESGKGDFFGPIVTAAFLIKDEKQETAVEMLGVRDSKTLTDNRVSLLASELKKFGTYEIILISPSRYNQLWSKMGNVNKILAWSHARALENILSKYSVALAISDQFGDEYLIKNALLENGKKINLVQMHKAESDLAVAAASILARDAFVKQLNLIGKSVGMTLSKGVSGKVIDQGVEFYKRHGKEKLSNIAKIHFKTYDKIISSQ
ncbi:ribonuclease HIII [Paenibacillus lactis]|uniref:Ribonuclease n=1 Tax=Paenibacillus lactis TaxID=228574 RepID=A0ABS4FGN6_9BACL|nr:ribonuclease HIII [Paenibacillus lactis]MBP1895422.1 ribonuclease HIII [Paenibacillus lactis]